MSAGLKLEQGEDSLPAGWERVSIGKISDLGGGTTPSKSNDDYWDGNIPWASPKDFDGVSLDETEDKLTEFAVSENSINLYNRGDIAMVVRSGVLRHSLPVAQLSTEMAVNQDIKVLQPDNDRIATDYLLNILLYEADRIRASCAKTGTTVESIETAFLKGYKLPLPPLSEQRRIADILSKVDEKSQQTGQIIEKIEELRKGVLSDILKEGIHSSQSEEIQLGPTDLTVPTSWEVVEIDDVVERLTNGISESQNTIGDGFPVTRIETIANGVVNLSKVGWVDGDPTEYEDYRIRENDILLSHINSLDHVGKAAQYREEQGTIYHGMNLLLLRFDWDLIHPRFAYICITSPYFRKLCRSFAKKAVNQVSLNQGDVGSLPLLLPEYEEQEMIAQRIECIDKKLQLERQQKKQLNKLKRGLMQDLLTGKVRVNTD